MKRNERTSSLIAAAGILPAGIIAAVAGQPQDPPLHPDGVVSRQWTVTVTGHE